MVSSSEIILVGTDNPATSGAWIAEMRQQTVPTGGFSNSSLNALAILYFAGRSSSHSFGSDVGIGTFTGNGSGTVVGATNEDDAGTMSPPLNFSCTYSVASNGRMTITGSNTYCSSQPPVFYLTSANTGFMLNSNLGVGSGVFEPQVIPAGGFNDASLSGTFFMGTGEVVNQGAKANIASMILDDGNMSQTSDQDSTTGQEYDEAGSGAYAINSGGIINITAPAANFLGIVISSNKFVTIGHGYETNPTIEVFNK
jgi:hypothetical protein